MVALSVGGSLAERLLRVVWVRYVLGSNILEDRLLVISLVGDSMVDRL